MARNNSPRLVSLTLAGFIASSGFAFARQADPTKQTVSAAAAAAKASPDLVGGLAKEIGGTSDQAAGLAGALFSVAKSRLKPEEFGQVAKAVPGIDSLLKAAPATGGPTGGAAAALGGLASLTPALAKLGIKPEMISKAIPFITSFVSKSGGAGVGNLLAGVLK